MVATCDICDKPAYNTITLFGVRKLKQPGLILCKQHDEEIQGKIVELVNSYLESKEGRPKMNLSESLTKLRNKLYDSLPSGTIDSFTLINLIQNHISKLDNLIESLDPKKDK